jgi:hypothetical protein
MATSYFEKFPKLLYAQNNDRQFSLVPDILRRVKIQEIISTNNFYFDEYDIKDGETPDIVADKFYRDPTLHWVILLANNITDPRFEWPLTDEELRKNAIQKYGSEDAINEIHHVVGFNDLLQSNYFEDSNFILAPETVSKDDPIRIIFEGIRDPDNPEIRKPLSHIENLAITDYVTNLEYEFELNEKRRRIKVLKPELVTELVAQLETIINA